MLKPQYIVVISELQKRKKLMQCPYCSHIESKVTDKRDSKRITRRRRECLNCVKRYTTHEKVELSELKVIKNKKNVEPFSRDKIKRGLIRACEKRPVSEEKIEKMIDVVEKKVRKMGTNVKTSYIGEQISRELKKADKVSYIRYASVYRDFTDLSDFKKEIKNILKK